MKTPVGELRYVQITGEGKNQELDPTKPANMCYVASIVLDKDSAEFKALKAEFEKTWEEYKKVEPKAVGSLKTSSIKEETIADPTGAIDEETGKVKKIPTKNMIITAYTKVMSDRGKKEIRVLDGKGNNITGWYNEQTFTIGNGSTGVLHGNLVGNTGGGKAKITFYLNTVQLGKLQRYEGMELDIEEIGEEIIIVED